MILDLDASISEKAEEGTHIEFKSIRALDDQNSFKEELPKDASAFANAAGGVIVVGIDEDADGRAASVKGNSQLKIKPVWFEKVRLLAVWSG